MSKTACAVATVLLLAGCSSGTATKGPGDDTTKSDFTVKLPFPTDWADRVDNRYLPLEPGTRWVYRTTTKDGQELNVVTVTDQHVSIEGVDATVVHDVVEVRGKVLEDTFDWYAQDADGNVWYLGEDTKSYEDGKVSTEGTWKTGVDGAEAGIIMLADPHVGDFYRQEHYKGHAEDQGKVLSLDEKVSGPAGSWTGVLKTRDTTPVEPDVVEHKFYAPGVGVVQESEVTGGEGEHSVLIEMTKG
jgi:hypothetical protein